MKIAVIDDESNVRDLINTFFLKLQEEKHQFHDVDSFPNAESFLNSFKNQYDIIMIDIVMPGMNGIKLSKEIRERDQNVTLVFITNLAQYAIKGYEVGAFDYILKPLSYPRFSTLIQRLDVRYARENRKETISINTRGKLVCINVNDICCVEIEGHRITFHIIDGRKLLYWGTLKEIEKKLTEPFFAKCKSCYIVNIHRIDYIEGTDVHMCDGSVVYISQNFRKSFMKAVADEVGN